MNALVGGDVNIVGLATDVVVAAAANHLPVKIVAPMMQVDPYALVTTASVPSWGALRGKTVMVTTKEDVTAITFRKMAEAQHLDGDRDFTLVIGTSTTVRYAALLSGNVAGAMLTQPWDYVAQNHGMHVLARAPDYVHDWLSNAYAVRTDWAAAHRSEVVRFIRAIRDANRFAADHPAEAIAILQRQTKTDAATAQHTYNDDFVAHRAFDPDERVDERALRNVIQAVAQHGDIPSVPPLSAIYDPSYSQEAAR
jgi:ABC-type nitrate/sulfonate/bicarbonate transport system substrate-binding protein